MDVEEQFNFGAIHLNQSSRSLGPDPVLPRSNSQRASVVEVASVFRMKLLNNLLKSKEVALTQFMSLIQNLFFSCLHLFFVLGSRELVCFFNLDNSFNLQTSLLNNKKAFGFCADIKDHVASHDAELAELSIKISHFFEGPVFSEGERLDIFEPLCLLIVGELKRKLDKIYFVDDEAASRLQRYSRVVSGNLIFKRLFPKVKRASQCLLQLVLNNSYGPLHNDEHGIRLIASLIDDLVFIVETCLHASSKVGDCVSVVNT